jgi:hypothetical protein
MPYSASTFVGTDSHNALSHKGKGAWWHDERGKGSSVGAHAQYITPHAQHNTREREWEAPRDDLVACGHAHMPQWATDDPQAYWQAADRYSRTNACLAKEILVSLSKEFDHRQNLALLHDFLRQLPPVPTT